MDDDKKNKARKKLPPQKIERKGKPNAPELSPDQKSTENTSSLKNELHYRRSKDHKMFDTSGQDMDT